MKKKYPNDLAMFSAETIAPHPGLFHLLRPAQTKELLRLSGFERLPVLEMAIGLHAEGIERSPDSVVALMRGHFQGITAVSSYPTPR